MKNAIKEYLELTKAEKKELWETAVFVFDTNIFLNLYRYTQVTRESLLKAMERLSERIWMPRQVAQELMKDRAKVIFDTLKIFDDLNDEKEKFIASCREKLRRESKDAKIDDMSKEIDKHIKSLMRESNYIQKVEDDKILTQLLNLFDGRVGTGFSETELEAIKKEGGERYAKQVPPGYKDFKKGEENNAFGDLIIWKEILGFASGNAKDVIYVTGDQKEDWWNRTNGRTLGPRIELRKEFEEKTGKKFHMYNMNGFLSHFKEMQGTQIQQSAIDEVKNYEKMIEEKARALKRQEWLCHRIRDNEARRRDLELILDELNARQGAAEQRLNVLRKKMSGEDNMSGKSIAELEELQKKLREIQAEQIRINELTQHKANMQKELEELITSQTEAVFLLDRE